MEVELDGSFVSLRHNDSRVEVVAPLVTNVVMK